MSASERSSLDDVRTNQKPLNKWLFGWFLLVSEFLKCCTKNLNVFEKFAT